MRHIDDEATYLKEEFLRSDTERLDTGRLEILQNKRSVRSKAKVNIAARRHLLLANIGHERVDLIALLDEPGEDARGV